MTPVDRQPAQIAVFGGSFTSQQLVFAHLLDEADRNDRWIDMDAVDVAQGECLGRRLGHYFDEPIVRNILDALATDDTCLLLTEIDALPHRDTDHLRWLGLYDGFLVRARPDRPC